MKTSTALLIGGGLVGAALLYRFMQNRSAGTIMPAYVPQVVDKKVNPTYTLPVVPPNNTVPVIPTVQTPVITRHVIDEIPVTSHETIIDVAPVYTKPRIQSGRELLPQMMFGVN